MTLDVLIPASVTPSEGDHVYREPVRLTVAEGGVEAECGYLCRWVGRSGPMGEFVR